MIDTPLTVSGVLASASTAVTAGAVAAQAGITIVTMTHFDILLTLCGLIIVGAFVGMGQALSHVPPLTNRQIAGKTMTAIGVAFTAVLAYYLKPDMNPLHIIGVGALLSVLGSGVLEAFVRAKFGLPPKDKTNDDG